MTLSFLLLAVSVARTSLAQQRHTAEYFSAAGQRALAADDLALAQLNFEALEKLEPAVAEVHLALAALYYKQRHFIEAVDEARAAQRLKPSLPRVNSLLGLSLAEAGRSADAVPGLESGLKQSTDPDLRRLCGLQLLRVYSDLGRNLDAVEVAVTMTRAYPNDGEVLYHTSRIFGNQAYVAMKYLHDRAPNTVWMLLGQGEAEESQDHYDAAIFSYQKVLALSPSRLGVHYRLGRVHLARFQALHKAEDRAQATEEFEEECKLDPANGNAAYELGELALEDNKLGYARTRFEGVVHNFPDFEQALVGLGRVYMLLNEAGRAVAAFQRATAVDPQDEVAWYRLARAERTTGDARAAEVAMSHFRTLHAEPSPHSSVLPHDLVTPQTIGSDNQP